MLVEKKMIFAECHSSLMTDQKSHTFITIMTREGQKSCSKILKQLKKTSLNLQLHADPNSK